MQVKAVMLIQLPKSTQMPALVLKTENFCQNGIVELLADFVSYVYVWSLIFMYMSLIFIQSGEYIINQFHAHVMC